MLVFSQLEKKGNLGNQLFQIASTIGIAKKNGHSFQFPIWTYSHFFENPIPMGEVDASFKRIKYEEFEYCDKKIGLGNYDIDGWLQTEKYFDAPTTRDYFTFKGHLKDDLFKKYKFLFAKETILISVRRGDFVNNPKFYQLGYKYYFAAILKFFPKWKEYNLIFISDDINYCKTHFESLDNTFFLDGVSPMEQLILGSGCNHFVISNSTFSWWVAWLGESQLSKVIRPIRNFSSQYKLENDKDYYPERWTIFNHLNSRIPLKYFKIILIGELYELWIMFKHRMKKIGLIRQMIDMLKKNKTNPILK